jgi:hypothetical protein
MSVDAPFRRGSRSVYGQVSLQTVFRSPHLAASDELDELPRSEQPNVCVWLPPELPRCLINW